MVTDPKNFAHYSDSPLLPPRPLCIFVLPHNYYRADTSVSGSAPPTWERPQESWEKLWGGRGREGQHIYEKLLCLMHQTYFICLTNKRSKRWDQSRKLLKNSKNLFCNRHTFPWCSLMRKVGTGLNSVLCNRRHIHT